MKIMGQCNFMSENLNVVSCNTFIDHTYYVQGTVIGITASTSMRNDNLIAEGCWSLICVRCILSVLLLVLPHLIFTTTWTSYCCYPCFIDKKTEVRVHKLPKVTQLVNGRVGPQTQAVLTLEPTLSHHVILLLIPCS